MPCSISKVNEYENNNDNILIATTGTVLVFSTKYSMYEVFGHIAMLISVSCFILRDSQLTIENETHMTHSIIIVTITPPVTNIKKYQDFDNSNSAW